MAWVDDQTDGGYDGQYYYYNKLSSIVSNDNQ